MEQREGRIRTARNGRERDRSPTDIPSREPRAVEGGRDRAVGCDLGRLGEPERWGGASWVNWQAALYVFVLSAACLVLVPLTSLWWIVPVLGAAVPLAHAVLQRPDLRPIGSEDRNARERELLEALAERDGLTPTTAAMHTSLTVEEASKMLGELADGGHLELRDDGGTVAYALRDRDRSPTPGGLAVPSRSDSENGGDPERLVEPLSERELEVLGLLASGRTNSEVARDLFVSVGTVKSHTGNIYRKLDARNRAEAVARAREKRLLR